MARHRKSRTPSQSSTTSNCTSSSAATPTHPTRRSSRSTSLCTNITPRITNCVASVNLGCRLDLHNISLQARNAEYNPRRFPAVIIRLRDPRSTALVFATGKMVVTGTKSDDETKLAARKFCRMIRKMGYCARMKAFKVVNMVASVDVGHLVRLEGLQLSDEHSLFVTYEPEIFPGLIYKIVEPKVTLLVFVSGKIVFTGALSIRMVTEACDLILPVLRAHRIA